jgi:serine/threonine protein kinase
MFTFNVMGAFGRQAGTTPGISRQDKASQKTAPKHARWNFELGTPIRDGRIVMKRLGGGSAYEVFLVWDERLFCLMVAKMLRPDRMNDARSLREMRREARMLERLAHPGLVRGFGAFLDGVHPHLLLEVVEGSTLGRVIKREGALPLQQSLPIVLSIAGILHYLSHERIVHLDIKPGNIVMSTTPRLIDLSIARCLDDEPRVQGGLGTAGYMAPEQCDPTLCPSGIGTAADIWGLGATLYHAVTGKRPFEAPTSTGSDAPATRRYSQINEEPAPLPKHLPGPLRDLIGRMLSKDPSSRPAAHEVAAALEPLVVELTGRHNREAR